MYGIGTNTKSGAFGAMRYAINQSYINNDPLVRDGNVGCGFLQSGAPEPWCSYGLPLAEYAHPSDSIMFMEGNMGAGPFLGGDNGTDPIAQMKADYPAKDGFPAGYHPDRPVHRSSNEKSYMNSPAFSNGPNKTEDGQTLKHASTDRAFHPHGGGTNYVFCDGHVKWQKVTRMSQHTAKS
jgi:prepilin-type processing-associated H-X9-DG protein